jgi:hypothetical protein
MDIKLALLAYVLPGLAVVLGIPMALGMVPPNGWYGYRTRKTLASPEVWYRANGIAGWCMAIAGIVALLHNIFFLAHHAEWASTTQQFFVAVSTAALILFGLGVSAFYVRKL